MTDVCPGCGGVADNGHDRCDPPKVYLCKGCEDYNWAFVDESAPIPDRVWPAVTAAIECEELKKKSKARRAELVWQSMTRILPHFLQVANTEDSVQGAMAAAIRAADAFLEWEERQ